MLRPYRNFMIDIPIKPVPLWKRGLDLLLILVSAPATFPLLILLALLVRVMMGAPVFFRQKRPGRGAKPFELVKFRTMTNETNERGELLPDKDRLTRFGKFLRATSLDELPELINVIQGEMSLVGPRPLLMEYLPLYSSEQARRHAVLPGLTGWAQVRGRNLLSWPEMFRLDLWYVDNLSLALDLRILAETIFSVLSRRGVNEPGQATRQKFTGER